MKDQYTVAHSRQHPAKQDTMPLREMLDTAIGNILLGGQFGWCS